jgi:hypothetical protein
MSRPHQAMLTSLSTFRIYDLIPERVAVVALAFEIVSELPLCASGRSIVVVQSVAQLDQTAHRDNHMMIT